MPLEKYGVLSGILASHNRDTPDDQGRWYHVHLKVRANDADYDCAIDIDSHQSATGVEWRVVPMRTDDLAAVAALTPGYHDLASTPGTGALDYYRSPWFQRQLGCVFVRMPDALTRFLIRLLETLVNSWSRGNHIEASVALESLLSPGRRCLVWGEPFDNGLGMHNVHQNQGDPAGSPWWDENGIWQDGGSLVEQGDGTWVAYISKFTTQSYRTDEDGHPL